jgi:predicted HTH transcriptional regulator
MILLELKKYIKQHEQVTLTDIKNHFDLSEEAAFGLINPLLKQGHVQEINASSCSTGKCSTGCSQNSKGPTYQWVDKRLKSLSIPIQIL